MSPTLIALAVAVLVSTSRLAARAPDTRQARRVGILGTAIALLAGLLYLALDAAGFPIPTFLAADRAWVGLPAFASALGLIAVAVTPVHGVRPATVSRMLVVTALSVAAGLVGHPVGICGLWALSMVPVWLDLRANATSRGAARIFAVYMVPSALLITASGVLQTLGMTEAAIIVLAVGIAIPEAVVPFHSWLPEFVEKAPLGMAVVFVTPRLGVYTFLWLLSPQLSPVMGETLALLGAVTAIIAAAMGLAQASPRRALAYLMMSQSALFFLGFGNQSAVAKTGALLMWIVVGLASAGFAMSVAAIEARRGPLSLDRPNGSLARVPRLATAYLVCGLACVGLPGTIGFIAEDLVVQGTAEGLPILGLALIAATALNAVSVVRGYLMLFTGTATHRGEQDLTRRESLVFSVILVLLVVAGLAPTTVVSTLAGHW